MMYTLMSCHVIQLAAEPKKAATRIGQRPSCRNAGERTNNHTRSGVGNFWAVNVDQALGGFAFTGQLPGVGRQATSCLGLHGCSPRFETSGRMRRAFLEVVTTGQLAVSQNIRSCHHDT